MNKKEKPIANHENVDSSKKMLTKAEMQVMNILWSLPGQQGFSHEIMEKYDEPKPAITTLLTFLKILQEKGFVTAEKKGRSHLFRPLITRDEYTENYMQEVKNNFFGGSFTSLVSFFAQREKLTRNEVEEIIQLIERGAERQSEERKTIR